MDRFYNLFNNALTEYLTTAHEPEAPEHNLVKQNNRTTKTQILKISGAVSNALLALVKARATKTDYDELEKMYIAIHNKPGKAMNALQYTIGLAEKYRLSNVNSLKQLQTESTFILKPKDSVLGDDSQAVIKNMVQDIIDSIDEINALDPNEANMLAREYNSIIDEDFTTQDVIKFLIKCIHTIARLGGDASDKLMKFSVSACKLNAFQP